MFERLKKFHWIVILSVLFLGTGYTLAYAINMTVDGKEDAGSVPGEGAFAWFVDESNPNTILSVVPKPSPLSEQFLTPDYALIYEPAGKWLLHSAGNISTATGQNVGESLSGLHAGTYRITPIRITPTDGAFMYDSWHWSSSQDLFWWKLNIRADINGQLVNYSDSILGSSNSYSSADSAFNAVDGSYIDIALEEGGSLNFWIYDWNSVDNAGSLSFSVTAVPEPSTLLLLIMGLPVLFRRVRS